MRRLFGALLALPFLLAALWFLAPRDQVERGISFSAAALGTAGDVLHFARTGGGR